MQEITVKVSNLTKKYGQKIVVENISFDVYKGEVLGFLGPNGAGKTTTIEMILGLVDITKGDVEIFGQKVRYPLSEDFKKRIGASFQSSGLYDDLKVNETLELFKDLYLDNENINLKEIIEETDLVEQLNLKVKQLSGGQRQRLIFAISIINDPDLIFLDEPTVGLDPKSRRQIWDLINKLKSKGKTIILTSHYMDEIEKLSDRIVFLNKGQIIVEGTVDEIKQKIGKDKETLEDIIIELES